MMLSTKTKPTQISVHTPSSSASATSQLKILCATDLSSKSERAIRRALSISERLGGQSLLLHVVSNELPMRLAGRRAERAHSALDWHARQLRHLRVKPSLSVRVGEPCSTIARAAKSWEADLIVLGTRRTRSTHGLVWSAAERIAHRAQRPVLVVNADASREYRNVMFMAKKKVDQYVQMASQFDLFDAAQVSIVPHVSLLDRALLGLASLFSPSTNSNTSPTRAEIPQRVRRNSQSLIEKAGLDLMGFEILDDGSFKPRALLSRLKNGKAPQLLIAEIHRSSVLAPTLPNRVASIALRTGTCDVLVASEASVRSILRVPNFGFSEQAYEDASLLRHQ